MFNKPQLPNSLKYKVLYRTRGVNGLINTPRVIATFGIIGLLFFAYNIIGVYTHYMIDNDISSALTYLDNTYQNYDVAAENL